MAISKSFWDKVAAKYDAETKKGPNYAARIQRAAEWIGPGANVLDVGCAGGHITLDLAAHVDTIHGIDISPKLIAMAQERVKEQGVSNATFTATAMEDATFEPGAFGAITAYSVLHLVPDAMATLGRMHELLGPGGVLIAEVPCREDIPWYFQLLIPMMTLVGKAPVVRLYSQAQYEAMFAQAGFEVQEVKIYNPKAMSRSVLARKV